jgi:phytanoyl-CoA hydroxylase
MSAKTLVYAPPSLDQAQIDAFHQDGFTVVRNLIPSPMIDELRVGYDQAVNGEYLVDGWKHRMGPDRILQLGMPHTHITEWNGHPYLVRLVTVGKHLLGEDIEYKYDQLIYKPPHNPVELLWHQDAGYGWPGKANYRSLTCWLAFSSVTKEMGSMQFVPGSHLEGIAEHVDATHRNPIGGALEVAVDASQAVTVEFGPGDATFHHGRTLHYTSGNSTDQPRRGLSTHMWPEPNE